jgi:hypothetical protein
MSPFTIQDDKFMVSILCDSMGLYLIGFLPMEPEFRISYYQRDAFGPLSERPTQ